MYWKFYRETGNENIQWKQETVSKRGKYVSKQKLADCKDYTSQTCPLLMSPYSGMNFVFSNEFVHQKFRG